VKQNGFRLVQINLLHFNLPQHTKTTTKLNQNNCLSI